MAAYGSSASAVAATATQVTVTKPSSLAAGDLMVAFVTFDASGTANTPSGWTLVTSLSGIGGSGDDKTYCFAKLADSGDAAASNFTFTYTGSNTNIEGIVYRITGTLASANNIYVQSAVLTGSEVSTSVFRFATGITPNVASSLLIMQVHADTGGANVPITTFEIETSNPSWTEDHDFRNSAQTRVIGAAHATRTEVTDTGYFQVTFNTGGGGDVSQAGGILLAITDTANGTATPSAIAMTATIPTQVGSGGGNVTAAAIALSGTIPTPTATGGDNDALWKNTDKPSAGTITNTPKP